MGATYTRNPWLMVLLALVLLRASAAPPSTPERAVAAARTALDRAEYAAAQKIIDDALTAFAKRDSEALWSLRVLRGELFLTQGKRDAAMKELAAELPPKYRRSETAVRRLLHLAFAAGRPELIDTARTLAEQHQAAMLGDVYRARAVVTNREADAREAVRQARRHGRRVTETKALAALAVIVAAQQRFGEAVEIGEEAVALARALELPNMIQNTQGNLGWAYLELGDYETAAELFRSAEALAARTGMAAHRALWLIQLGNVHFHRRDYAGAERYNRMALAAGAAGKDRGYALANLARAALEQGRYAEALRLNAEATKVKRELDDEEAVLRSHIVAARVAVLQDGRHDRAEALLRGVLRDAKTANTRFEAAARLADVYARTKRHDLATSYYERAVATAREARKDITDRDLRFAFFNTVAEMFDAYVDFLVTTKRVDEALAVTERSRAESLEEGLKIGAQRKVDPRTIAKQNDATILCYWLARERSYLWVIEPARTTLHHLPPDADIETAAEAYRRDIVEHVRGTIEATGARGERLYRMLVAPAAIPRAARVIVIADGHLHTLNFETLVVPGPRPRYWIEDAVVMNAPSLRVLARNRPETPGSPSVLLVGNAPSPDPEFPTLRYAAAEMRRIERRFPRRMVLEGGNATPSRYRAASPEKFDYVHFVAHAVSTRRRPLDSAIILARDADTYRLRARDVLASPLRARLVTISSCYGAGTRTYAGEGVVGLAWAFLSAGADQVIAALWKVDDVTTPDLMDRMYAHIRAGRDPAAALREAKLTLVRSKGAARKPRYWAPFVLYAGT